MNSLSYIAYLTLLSEKSDEINHLVNKVEVNVTQLELSNPENLQRVANVLRQQAETLDDFRSSLSAIDPNSLRVLLRRLADVIYHS